MNQNDQQGARKAQKKPVINKWEGEGIVRTRSGNDNDEIKFFPFQNGGGAIHISVACTEINGADANGQPKAVTSYVPVNIMTNKLITQQQLMGVRPGMKVHVVGKLQPESYTSKKTGQKVTSMVVNAYVFEILEMPQQPYQQQPGYAQGAYQPPYGGQPGYSPQGGYPQQQGGMYPAYGAPQPGYPQQGSMPPQGGYPQQGGYQPPYGGQPGYMPPQGVVPGAQPQQQAGGTSVPPYYQPPQGGYAGPPVGVSGGPVDDLPPGDIPIQ